MHWIWAFAFLIIINGKITMFDFMKGHLIAGKLFRGFLRQLLIFPKSKTIAFNDSTQRKLSSWINVHFLH